MPSQFFNPVRSVHGAGALSALPTLVGDDRVLLVTFPEARGLGLVDRVAELIPGRLAGVVEDVQPNPDVAELRGQYEAFWQGPDTAGTIVALGGGSVIDTAKTLMVGTVNGRFDELLAVLSGSSGGSGAVPARTRRLVAVPTTAGTGSEVTPWATVWDRAAQQKHSLHLDQTWPAAAVIDPTLMLSLPPAVTLPSGLDALSHALESIWNVHHNPVSDTFAVAAVHDIFETLPALMRHPGSLALRSRMALAALKAGLAFSNTRTALAHSISYAMTLRHGLPHGIACSFTLPMVCELAIGRRSDRDEVLQRALGPLDEAPRRLATFIEGLGVDTSFAGYGVDAAEADAMVAHALTGPRGRNFIGAADVG